MNVTGSVSLVFYNLQPAGEPVGVGSLGMGGAVEGDQGAEGVTAIGVCEAQENGMVLLGQGAEPGLRGQRELAVMM